MSRGEGAAAPIPVGALRDPILLLATGFGAGLLRPAPGTWGSLVAIPLILVLWQLPLWLAWGLLAGVIAGGFPLCAAAGRRLGVADHGAVVIDEIAGLALAAMLLPPGIGSLLAVFLAFRFFDIVKPWPVSWADRELPGALGVMLDDLLAALYAAATVVVLLWAIDYALSVAAGV